MLLFYFATVKSIPSFQAALLSLLFEKLTQAGTLFVFPKTPGAAHA
jgi:hypothetical protein